MDVNIKVIGAPSIEIDGRPFLLPLKKAEAILYYLAIEGPSSREKLASMFWSAKDENSACNNFRNALYLLKRSLPKEAIKSDRRNVYIENISCDLAVAEKISDCSYPLRQYFSEELLRGFDVPDCADFGRWLLTVRSQFRKKLTEQLRVRITSCYDAQDEDNLEASLEMLVAADPFDEDAVLELTDLYFKRCGAAKASSLFRDYRRRMCEEMSLAPSTRAEEYFRRMLLRGSAEGEEQMILTDDFFEGRVEEQQKILEHIERNKGRTSVVFIEGEAGMGKTSLLQRVLRVSDLRDDMVLSTSSYEAGQDYPYSSWSSLVSQAALYSGDSSEESCIGLSLLSGVFPNYISDRRTVCNADSAAVSDRTPISIGKAVASLVCRASAGRRAVIILEDIHWFDPQSLHMIEVFINSLSVPSVIFMTSRPEKSSYVVRALSRLDAGGQARSLRVQIGPLSRGDTVSFCRRFLDRTLIESKENDYFYKNSEGIPLLIVEIIKILRTNSHAELSGGGLGGVMLARFGEISEKSREFLKVLSVFTDGASIESVAAVMGETKEHIYPVAEELLSKRLITEVRTIDRGLRLSFSHAMLRDCMYDSIPGFKLSEYHKKAAELLNTSYSPQRWDPALSSMLCYHYTKAGLTENVLKQHLREMIFDITLNHDLFPLVQDDVLYSCSSPYNDRNDTENKMEEMSRLLALIRAGANEENREEVLAMEASYMELSGGYLVCWGEYEKARILLKRAMKLSREHSFSTTYIHCLVNMGHLFLQTDNAEMLMRMAREMLRVARDEEREKYIGIALRYIGVAFQITGDYEKSEKALRRSMDIFMEQELLGKKYTISVLAAECYIGENYHRQGDFDRAESHFRHCISVCEGKKLFWCSSHFYAHLADVAFDLGDKKKMFDSVDRGSQIFERCQGGRCGSMLYSLKAIADAERGRYDDAYRSFEIGELLAEPVKKRSWTAGQAMAGACLARMLEEGELPPEFNKILKNSAKDYASKAASIYREIPVPHRVRMLEKLFGVQRVSDQNNI